MNYKNIILFASLVIFCMDAISVDAQGWFGKKAKKEPIDKELGGMFITEAKLTDQYGQEVDFHEFIKDRIVAINFIFTKCKTICPPMGANFARLVREVNCLDPDGEQFRMISISIDPRNDTPKRLKKWSENFGAPDNWALLTGKKDEVNQLLKDLKVYTPLKEDHAPLLIMGKEGENNWIRTSGLAPVATIVHSLEGYADVKKEEISEEDSADLDYFSNTKLTNQHGVEQRFYSDLLKDQVVIINPFFGDCNGSCPKMHNTLMVVQDHLGEKLGRDVNMLSITVDPKKDTPERLATYAESFAARDGWHFLTGPEDNVNAILRKLGKYVTKREAHDAIMLIGNTKTRLWKKVNGLSKPQEIIAVLDSVIDDQGI